MDTGSLANKLPADINEIELRERCRTIIICFKFCLRFLHAFLSLVSPFGLLLPSFFASTILPSQRDLLPLKSLGSLQEAVVCICK